MNGPKGHDLSTPRETKRRRHLKEVLIGLSQRDWIKQAFVAMANNFIVFFHTEPRRRLTQRKKRKKGTIHP